MVLARGYGGIPQGIGCWDLNSAARGELLTEKQKGGEEQAQGLREPSRAPAARGAVLSEEGTWLGVKLLLGSEGVVWVLWGLVVCLLVLKIGGIYFCYSTSVGKMSLQLVQDPGGDASSSVSPRAGGMLCHHHPSPFQ